MPLRVGLTYNLKVDSPTGDRTDDWAAECEEIATVERIANALVSLGHQVIYLPFNKQLVARLQQDSPDIVFNIAEGWCGRNRESIIPAILEYLEIPYTGSDALCLGICLDKAVCKCVVGAAGVPVSKSWVVHSEDELEDIQSFPVFVKPNTEGSSKGIRGNSRVEDQNQLIERVRWVTQIYQQPALIEPFLPGREFTIGVIGNNPPVSLPIMEVVPDDTLASTDFVYSYETKTANLERLICPAALNHSEVQQLTNIALAAHKAVGCLDVSRVDVRMDTAGHPYFLEINPLPGLADCSLLPMQAAAAGVNYNELINAILTSACRRYSSFNNEAAALSTTT